MRHLDRQIQLYDSRKGGFGSEPCLSFGRRNTNGKFPGRYTRGSVHLVHFAMASEDGGVLLWDFRNSKVGSFFSCNREGDTMKALPKEGGDREAFPTG